MNEKYFNEDDLGFLFRSKFEEQGFLKEQHNREQY